MEIIRCGAFVFFFKQKTAYERRISDWSSDVCSSDLLAMLDSALEAARPDQRTTLIREFTKATESRLRFYGADGRRVSDSFASGPPTYTLRDPELQPWKIGRAHV